MARIVDLDPIDVVEMDDEFLVIDASDTSAGPLGTDKRATTAKVGETLVAVASGAINLFDDTIDGLAGTTAGDYFSVPSGVAAEFTILYRHDAGPVATEIKRLPSNSGVDAAIQAAIDAESAMALAEDAQEAAEEAADVAEAAEAGAVISANTATAQAQAAANSAGAAAEIVNISEVQTFTNPLARAVRVAMAAEGVGGAVGTGIQVLDNVQADYGTGNYTLARRYFLATTRPSANQILSQKHDGTNGRTVTLLATGVIRHTINSTNYDSTAAIASSTNVILDLAVVVTRSAVAAAGSVLYYVNGVQLGASVTITAGAPVSIDNSVAEYFLGTSTTRTAGEFYHALNYNRALSAAEVLSLAVNGPALADLGASQIPFYVSDFSAGEDGLTPTNGITLTGNVDGIGGEDDWLKVERTGPGGNLIVSFRNTSFLNKNIQSRYRIHNPSGSTIYIGAYPGSANAGEQTVGFKAVPAASSVDFDFEYLMLRTQGQIVIGVTNATGLGVLAAPSSLFYVKNVIGLQVGITAQYNAQDCQGDTGQIFDSSGNKNHALLPASGATVIGKPVSEPRQVRGTNSWAETHELQYIGGSNHPILPANAIIESIVGVITSTGGSGVQDIIIGDGSDDDRYVTLTTGLTTGTNVFTLTSTPYTNGTNLKLTVDPDSNCTMSIAWTITYRELES